MANDEQCWQFKSKRLAGKSPHFDLDMLDTPFHGVEEDIACYDGEASCDVTRTRIILHRSMFHLGDFVF